MRRVFTTLLAVVIMSGIASAQHPGFPNATTTRPQWGGYYNGYGVVPGYSYNPRSGWNHLTYPSGARFSYRDGYVPMRYYNYNYNRYRRYYPQGSYADIINGFVGP